MKNVAGNLNRSASRGNVRRGMTLVEILVVLAIVVVLLALGVAAMQGVWNSTASQQAKVIMQTLMSAHDEYRAQSASADFIEFDGTSSPDYESIEVFIEEVIKVPEAKTILLQVDKLYFKNLGAGNLPGEVPQYIVDPWGEPFQYRHFHASDGTRVHAGENGSRMPAYGTEAQPMPFFASSGPDTLFGAIDSDEAKDNLFSYSIE